MSDTAWLFIAFLAVWIGLGVYLFSLGTRQKRLERRLKDLETRS
jgi:CcmD family protein